MEFRVNKSKDFPIYQQLKEQMKYFILSGALKEGEKVPSPIELEHYLKINRNTIIAAYKELEKDGVLVSKRGQGTYVTDRVNISAKKDKNQELLDLTEETIEKAKELGFSAEDLFTILYNRVVLDVASPQKADLQALLVECNQPDLDYYRDVLTGELGIIIKTCLLSELADNLDDFAIKNADFVITNFTHLEDVKAILEPLGKEVIGFMAAPHIHTFMRIAQLDAGKRVGLVCTTESGSLIMRKAIENAGIRNVEIKNCGIENKAGLTKLFQSVDFVVSSRMAFDAVKRLIPPNVQLLEFFSELDRGGLEMLKQYVKSKIAFNKAK